MANRTILFWTLSALFAFRVAGQAVQRWLPQSFLPPFAAFQGSSLAYPLLLSSQLLILWLMLRTSWRMQAGALQPSTAKGRVWAWLGGLYMTGSLLRIGIGLAIPTSASWFHAWIPAFFHVVLASFVLALAQFHLCNAKGAK